MKTVLKDIYSKTNNSIILLIKKEGKVDWLHLNSVDIKNGKMILSSRELSSIICLEDIYNEPKVSYILGDKKMYEGTSYYDLVYNQKGDFYMHLGQHTAYFYDNKENYISLYNNNFGESPATEWFDWEKHHNEKMEQNSFFYLYKLNEEDKTYELIQKIDVPYSTYMSSSQVLDNGNRVVSSRKAKIYGEYNENGDLISQFKMNRFSYRVNKYNFINFWWK